MMMRATIRAAALAGVSALAACMPPRAPAQIEYRSGPQSAGPPAAQRADGEPVVLAAAPQSDDPAPVIPVIPVEPAGVGGGPAPARADGTDAPATSPSGEGIVVGEGDGLYSLSARHMTSLRALIELNALEPPFRLEVGQRLSLPAPNTHVVEPGETFYGVARRYRVQLRSLAYLNDIEPPYAISPGQALILPALARDWEAVAEPLVVLPASAPARVPNPPARLTEPPLRAPTTDAARRPAAGPASRFLWPLEGQVVEGFGPQERGRRHDGVNIAARAGQDVRAAADGTVVYAGDELAGYGRLVLIQHADGWVSAYAHNQTLRVSEGAAVRQGAVIAQAGATGAVDTPQLHFELRHNGRPVDPVTQLPS